MLCCKRRDLNPIRIRLASFPRIRQFAPMLQPDRNCSACVFAYSTLPKRVVPGRELMSKVNSVLGRPCRECAAEFLVKMEMRWTGARERARHPETVRHCST